MIACRLVTADGEVLEIGEDDERLDAVRLSVGALGVLTTVTLRVLDGFYVSMRRTRVPDRGVAALPGRRGDVLSPVVPPHGVFRVLPGST